MGNNVPVFSVFAIYAKQRTGPSGIGSQKIDKNCVELQRWKEIMLSISNITPRVFFSCFFFFFFFYSGPYTRVSRARCFYFKLNNEPSVNEMQIEMKQEKICRYNWKCDV